MKKLKHRFSFLGQANKKTKPGLSGENSDKPALPELSETVNNPYLNAKLRWNERTGRLVSERQVWQLVGLFCLAITLASMGGVIYMGAQPKFVPYVVEVDQLGSALAVSKVYPSSPIDDRIMKAVAANFISNARVITLDGTLQQDFIDRVFSVIAPRSAAFSKMIEFYQTEKPMERAKEELVTTKIESVVRRSKNSWQVDWKEVTTSRAGALLNEVKWRALITFEVRESGDALSEAHLRANPLGIYVVDFDWTKQGY